MSASQRLERAWRDAAAIPGLQSQLAAVLEHMVREAKRADRAYSEFHWERQADKVAAGQAPMVCPGDVLTELGKLATVGYVTRKGRSGTMYEWVHSFSRPLPVLASTRKGQLVVLGGSYRITTRGIVG